jgi:hypothetical protein
MIYDKSEYEKSKSRYPSLIDAISGRATVRMGDVPDSRVRAGLVFNSKLKRFEPNGKLNSDIVEKVLGT